MNGGVDERFSALGVSLLVPILDESVNAQKARQELQAQGEQLGIDYSSIAHSFVT